MFSLKSECDVGIVSVEVGENDILAVGFAYAKNIVNVHSLLRHPITKTDSSTDPLTSSGAVYSVSMLLGLLVLPWLAHSAADLVSRKSPDWEIVGRRVNVKGVAMESYLGIPYAQPPVGPLRYKKPEAIENFPDYFEAFNFASSCHQIRLVVQDYISEDNSVFEKVPMDEDCLYLNIWTPSSSSDDRKPVMFWIHGGAFLFGSGGYIYDGSVLGALGDVVIVTINYRLGSFGFLVSETEDAPGNMGLYDQLMALRWVHDNIEYFGGDPDKITVFGESAGGISVGALLTSKLAENLFKRAIMQSGAPTIPYFVNTKKTVLNYTDKFSEILGCNSEEISIINSPEKVLECLRGKSADELAKADYLLLKTSKTYTQFMPVMEEEFLNYESTSPFKPGFYNNHEIMIGVNKDEMGSLLWLVFPEMVKTPKLSLKETVKMTETLLRESIGMEDAHSYLDHYFKYVPCDNLTAVNVKMSDITSDLFFICPAVFFADNQAEKGSPLYFYYFTYPTKTVYFQLLTDDWPGAFHFDDVIYVFGLPLALEDYNYTEAEKDFSRDIIQLWTTFAKTG
ncbi:BCHE [Cordylochernes scorpioides]|uniref:Carboxylic ester hydrolase n=1 Tax=Cordylochernes scorpioides TaxID=51811 RepID=A0ABY6LHF9_9ARAC|nr:BCHE [Cordylochernes scorpioides]